jgi:hypothetical protein
MDVNSGVWHRDGMARDDPKFIVRMPAELKSRLEQVARANGRSTTAEVVQRLQASFVPRPHQPVDAEALAGLLEEFIDWVRAGRPGGPGIADDLLSDVQRERDE